MIQKFKEKFSNVAILKNIDEIPTFDSDPMTEDVFFDQIEQLEKEEKENTYQVNKNRRTFVVSATLGKSFQSSRLMGKTSKKKMKKLLKENPETTPNMKINEIMNKIKFKNKTKIIDETQDAILPSNLEILQANCAKEEKNLYLYYFLKIHQGTPTIIFCNSITSVKRTQAFLTAAGVKAVSLHAHLQQRQRMDKIDKFRLSKSEVLICTDIASRGLDIPRVDLVIHYHIPKDIDTFIHRCGRTARLGKTGKSVIISDGDDCGRFKKYKQDLEDSKTAKNKNNTNALGGGKNFEDDEDKEEFTSLRSQNGSRIKKITVHISKLDEIRDIVSDAAKIESEQFKVTQDTRENAWFTKMADEADIVLDEKSFAKKKEATDEMEVKVKSKKQKLDNVSGIWRIFDFIENSIPSS